MDDVMVAIRYIFVISLILVVIAYWGGTTHVLGALGTNFNNLILTVTGRNQQGQFAAYPTGGPTS